VIPTGEADGTANRIHSVRILEQLHKFLEKISTFRLYFRNTGCANMNGAVHELFVLILGRQEGKSGKTPLLTGSQLDLIRSTNRKPVNKANMFRSTYVLFLP
jgi:hypothetical protein